MTVAQIVNQFSFLLVFLPVFVGASVWLARRRAGWTWWAAWSGLLAVFLALVLTWGQATTARYDTPASIRQALVSAEEPTLVEFFSNY